MGFFAYFQNYYIDKAFGVTYILTEIAYCFCIALAFNNLNIKKWQDWVRLICDFVITFICYLILASFNYWMYSCANNENMMSICNQYSRFYIWPYVTFIHTIYPENSKRYSIRFTYATMIATFITYTTSISGCIGSLINKNSNYNNAVWTSILMIACLIIITILIKIFTPFKFHYSKFKADLMVNICFLLSFLIPLAFNLVDSNTSIAQSIVLPIIMIIDILIYIIYYYNAKSYNEIIDLQSKELKHEAEENQIEISNSKYKELHEIKHELNNQMTILSTLINEKRYDELEKYFADIHEQTRIAVTFINTGNSIVDTVLNMEISKAESNNIKLDYKISIPNKLNFKSQDLISLLTNLIDNAIEGELRDNLNDPITISLAYNEPYLYVEVSNKVSKERNKEKLLSLHSSKANRLNHGYGVGIIKRICQEYNGVYKYTIEDENTFKFFGMLENPKNNN